MAKSKTALLYERLSCDDELSGESFSIRNQTIMPEDFASRERLKLSDTHFAVH